VAQHSEDEIKAALARIRECIAEARYLARQFDWKILEYHLLHSQITVGDIEKGFIPRKKEGG
jgi:hypothetical protein